MKNSSQVRLLYKRNLVGGVHLELHFVLWFYENLRFDDVVECGSINRISFF